MNYGLCLTLIVNQNFYFRIETMVEVHLDPLAAQTEDPETILTGEAKNNSVDSDEGALIPTGNKIQNCPKGPKINSPRIFGG